MSCERCECLPSRRAPQYVLLASPHPGTRKRILHYLTQAHCSAIEHELGVRLDVDAQRWREGMVLLADALTGPERRDTRVCLVAPGDDPYAISRAVLAARTLEETMDYFGHEWLLDLLGREALTVEFQAIIAHRPARVAGYECFLRGLDRIGQRITPAELYGAADALDLVHYLDRRARLAAIHAADHMADGSENLLFFIHFPPTAIYSPLPCLQSTLDAVAASHLKPAQIVFEAPDVEHITDREHLTVVFTALRKHGFRLALDNVRGYASLVPLGDLRPDYIKLDGQLLRRAADSALEQRILRDVLRLAQEQEAVPVACGIEHARELEFAASLGVALTQGYYHAPPQPGPLSPEQWAKIREQAECLITHP